MSDLAPMKNCPGGGGGARYVKLAPGVYHILLKSLKLYYNHGPRRGM